MGRKAESPPSKLWMRLIEALGENDLPTSQNGVAKLLGMNHTSVRRWYHGEGLPELDTSRKLAIKAKVSLDWLVTGRGPKYPISKDPVLARLVEICLDLDSDARREVLRTAQRWQQGNR